MFASGIILILLFAELRQGLNAAPLTDTVLSNSVFLKFSNVNLSTWHAENRSLILAATLANLSTDYCKTNYDNCGVLNGTHFKAENVKTGTSYPKNRDQNLETLVYVEVPASGGSSMSRLPGSALFTIISNGKSKLSTGVGYDVASVASGQTHSSSEEEKVNDKLNKIMIPVAFILLLLIALVAWILHRGQKKKQAREERRRYMALQNAKNYSNLRENAAASMVSTADVPQTQITEQPEGGPVVPDLEPPAAGAQPEYEENNNVRRHKKRRALPRKPPTTKSPTDESDDVFDDDTEPREKPKKKGRRRKGRRSYDVNREGSGDEEYEMRTAKVLAYSQGSSEGTHGEPRENTGYQRDSEKGESDPSRSNTDSAVELSSSVASSANHRARTLPPIPRTSATETV